MTKPPPGGAIQGEMNSGAPTSRLLILTLTCVMAGACKQTEAPPPPAAAHSASAAPAVSSAPTAASSKSEAPSDYLAVRVSRVVLTAEGGGVLLQSETDGRLIPIFIGGTEAISIGLRKEKQKYTRPLTHDLLDSVVRQLGGELVKVQVERIENNVFIGRIFLRQGERTFDLDARPSDAVALALGNQVPIFVAKAVLDEAGIRPEDLLNDEGIPAPRTGRPDEPTQL